MVSCINYTIISTFPTIIPSCLHCNERPRFSGLSSKTDRFFPFDCFDRQETISACANTSCVFYNNRHRLKRRFCDYNFSKNVAFDDSCFVLTYDQASKSPLMFWYYCVLSYTLVHRRFLNTLSWGRLFPVYAPVWSTLHVKRWIRFTWYFFNENGCNLKPRDRSRLPP